MKKLLSYDIMLQWRQGFWLIYFIICLIYLAILFSIPPGNRLFVSLLFVLSDTSVLGVTFVGALILLEKQQNVLQSLFVTPLHPGRYLWSKTLSLGLIATSMSLILLSVPNPYDNLLWVRIYAVAASSVTFTLLGIGFAVRTETLNQYFMNMLMASMIIIVPTVPFLLWNSFGWLVIFPVNSALEIMFPERFHPGIGRIVLDAVILAGWCLPSYWFAKRQLVKNILEKA